MQVINNGERREIGLCEAHARELHARSGGRGWPQPVPAGAAEGAAAGSTSATPALDEFGRDLLEDAREGRIDPVIGREKEIEQTVEILARRRKNNAVLI